MVVYRIELNFPNEPNAVEWSDLEKSNNNELQTKTKPTQNIQKNVKKNSVSMVQLEGKNEQATLTLPTYHLQQQRKIWFIFMKIWNEKTKRRKNQSMNHELKL